MKAKILHDGRFGHSLPKGFSVTRTCIYARKKFKLFRACTHTVHV